MKPSPSPVLVSNLLSPAQLGLLNLPDHDPYPPPRVPLPSPGSSGSTPGSHPDTRPGVGTDTGSRHEELELPPSLLWCLPSLVDLVNLGKETSPGSVGTKIRVVPVNDTSVPTLGYRVGRLTTLHITSGRTQTLLGSKPRIVHDSRTNVWVRGQRSSPVSISFLGRLLTHRP